MQSGIGALAGQHHAVSRADRFGLIDDRHVRSGAALRNAWATERRLPIP